MAKVTITVEDNFEDSTYTFSIESDPPFANPHNPKERNKPMTPAQQIAAGLFGALTHQLSTPEDDDEDGD